MKISRDCSKLEEDCKLLKEKFEEKGWMYQGKWFYKNGLIVFPGNPYSLVKAGIGNHKLDILIPTENIPVEDYVEILEAIQRMRSFYEHLIESEA